MFNIGLIEFLLIFFFVVLLVRPEDIPKVAKNTGLFYRKISRYFFNLRYELSQLSDYRSGSTKKIKKKKLNEIPKPLKRIKK